MPALSLQTRQDIATRLGGGQTPRSIAETLHVGLKTVYRLRRAFRQPDGSFQAVAANMATKQAFTREQLVECAGWLQEEPKLTLAELLDKAVAEGFFANVGEAPDESTLWRNLKRMGFKWKQPKYSDPRAKRGVVQFERCEFRRFQDNGLDPTTLLSMDESNFHIWDQPRRAWGTVAKPATLEKPKGKTMRNSVYATIGFKMINGEAKALIHWVFLHPRKTWHPLPDTIQPYEHLA